MKIKKGYILSPSSRSIDIAVKYPILAAVFFLGLSILFLISGISSKSTTTGLLSIVIIVTTITLISFSLVHNKGGIRFDITSPLSFYGIFYFLYYLFPYLLMFFTGRLPVENELNIALLLFLGYLAWYAGVKSSRVREGTGIPVGWISEQEARALLLLCIIGIGSVIYVCAWRTSHGIFFTHSRYYEQELSVASSIRDVFLSQLQLPIILFLGMLSVVKYKKIAYFSRRLFVVYGIGIFLIFILSSQTRPAITSLIFIFVSINMYRLTTIKLRYLVAMGIIGFIAVVFVQGVRVESYELVSSENQFIYAVTKSGFDAILGLKTSGSEFAERIISRSGASLDFLSVVIDATKSSGTYLYGSGIATSLFGIVPRFVWPNKPVVIPLDLVVQAKLGITQYDATLGPIIQFYVEGGWLGVIIGFFSFGWLMGTLTNRVMLSNKMGMWIIFFIIWSRISNLELELMLGLIVTVRNAFVVYLLYKIIFLFLRLKR